MRLGEVLVARGLLSEDDVAKALQRQGEQGGRLGQHLVSLGLLTDEQLQDVVDETPVMPRNVAETGVSRGILLGLVLKQMRVASCETMLDFTAKLHLGTSVVQELLDEAMQQKLVYVLGSETVGLMRYMRYALSDQGRVAASEAMEQSLYLGPAPVSLDTYRRQVLKQKLSNERITLGKLQKAFTGLILPDQMLRKLTPAVSAGRTVLLYGPPGNGKTSIGSRISDAYRHPVYIPFAVEVAGQIIKVFDAGLHKPYGAAPEKPSPTARTGVHVEAFDGRWVTCRRPVAMAGGEMTLDTLDLKWDPITKCYDAPLHMKALNGLLLIDDFGRQRVSPTELLNRWIVPLESRIDYLQLNTGNTFQLPFDELVIFSTNLAPADLMDPAFLRRIPYKLEVVGPSEAEYREIFHKTAHSYGLTIDPEAFELVVRLVTQSGCYTLASFQPKFICEQVAEECRCFDLPPVVTPSMARSALENLYVGIGQLATAQQESAAPALH